MAYPVLAFQEVEEVSPEGAVKHSIIRCIATPAMLENKKALLFVAICIPSLFHCTRRHVSFPGVPSPYPRHYSMAFDYYVASARSPTRWPSRVLFRGKGV